MNRLLEIGFCCAGNWELDNELITCKLIAHEKTSNLLYAFISNGAIKYIGKTTQTLRKRMYGYQNPGLSQATNIKNNKLIKHLLESSEAVDIFVLPDPGLFHYGNFHLSLAAGLEDSLIGGIDPPWNGSIKTSTNHKRKEDASTNPIQYPTSANSFEFTLQPTYYGQGFFNIVIRHEHLFGKNGQNIEIHCGNNGSLLTGYINRSANTNNTPRIMGGTGLRDWFHEHCNIGDQIDIDVLSPVSIQLRFTK